ncbi:hypothetical protein ANCCAN_27939, partial [Ancylostoma caninum]
VRGVTPYAPEGADIGDVVISVDGKLISKVGSAADVERLLTEGRLIRLRKGRRTTQSSAVSVKAVPQEKPRLPKPCSQAETAASEASRLKSEEKLLRSIEELLQTEKKYVDDLTE